MKGRSLERIRCGTTSRLGGGLKTHASGRKDKEAEDVIKERMHVISGLWEKPVVGAGYFDVDIGGGRALYHFVFRMMHSTPSNTCDDG